MTMEQEKSCSKADLSKQKWNGPVFLHSALILWDLSIQEGGGGECAGNKSLYLLIFTSSSTVLDFLLF